ncbi:MAG: energy transducer TonB, partial [Treponemataceae bacterium]|nr:energy transducer TonB [Treponemataceae bacterium]
MISCSDMIQIEDSSAVNEVSSNVMDIVKSESKKEKVFRTRKENVVYLDSQPEMEEEIPETEQEIPEESIVILSPGQLKAEETYKTYVLKRIASKKSYPLQARANEYVGKVRLHLVIDKEGQVLLCQIIDSSSYEILDKAALEAVNKASPFKPMKDGV